MHRNRNVLSAFHKAHGRRCRVATTFLIGASVFGALFCGPSLASGLAAETSVLLPGDFTLAGAHASQRLVFERQVDGKFRGQLADSVSFTSSDPKVVDVVDGYALPVANGEATISARSGDRTATVKVRVVGLDQPAVWSFRNHVEAVLAKSGCSSGPCHGAQAGKGGFKISLFGYDPEGDHQIITRQARGRRIVPSDPGRSLLLTKPSGLIPHKGGVRFSTDALEYRVLADWIAADCPAPKSDDPRLSRLEILPPGVVLKPGDEQQFLVRAHFSDGHTEDVTRWAKFTSTNETVAGIDNNVGPNNGRVKVVGYGEGAVTVWYLSRVVVATITSPMKEQPDPQTFAKAKRRNFIDELVLDKLRNLNIPPSPQADDQEFVRRVYLDTIGLLPTIEETQSFLTDKSADKRDRLIDTLLDRAEFVDYWTYRWSDLLLVNSEKLKTTPGEGGDPRSTQMWAYYSWVRRKVEANTPWDVMVRELLTATGSTLENGAANFFMLHKDPLDLSETTTVAFLGMNINCARCHNHPLEKWTNNQYYAMANLYARVRVKNTADGGAVVYSASDGDLVQPLTGRPQPPTPLDDKPLSLTSPDDRRMALARWLTAPENPYFARSVTNRVWAAYMGVGLVEMVDDMRITNPASNEQLLSALAKHLVDHHYDLKELMRTILQSATYQRTSQPLPGNLQDKRFYSHYYPRRLMAEVLLDAVSQTTGVPSTFAGYPAGWRALQLPDSSASSYFLNTFGRPDRLVTCDCERTAEPSMVQVLHISNGDTMNKKLSAPDNVIDRWLKAKLTPEQIVDQAYMACLSRQPTQAERSAILQVLTGTPESERRLVLEDLFWGLLSSKEFLFNH